MGSVCVDLLFGEDVCMWMSYVLGHLDIGYMEYFCGYICWIYGHMLDMMVNICGDSYAYVEIFMHT